MSGQPASSRWRPASGLTPSGQVRGLQQLTGAVGQGEPGPLERDARPVTAANPIPRRVHFVRPFSPPEAAAIDASAVVAVRLTLDALGRVAEVRSDRPVVGASDVATPPGSAGMPAVLELDQAAFDAIRQWEFTPSVRNGRVVPVLMIVTVQFSL
jgi:outer membrane biosynthesis protein TonB